MTPQEIEDAQAWIDDLLKPFETRSTITPTEFAEAVSWHRRKVLRMIEAGDIAVINPGDRRKSIPVNELRRYAYQAYPELKQAS